MTLISIILLWLVAPVSIYLGLIVFNSISFTFITFYGLVCIAIPIIDFVLIRKMDFREYLRTIGFKNFKQTALPATLLGIFFGLFILGFFIGLEKSVLKIEDMQAVLTQWNIDKKYVIPFMFMMIFTNSVCEEIYWRGYIYHKLNSNYSPVLVIVLTAFFYASYHPITILNLFPVLFAILFAVIIFGIGIFWGYMRRKYDSLFFPVISHMFADLGIMMIYFIYFGR